MKTCKTCRSFLQDDRFREEGVPAGTAGWCGHFMWSCSKEYGCGEHKERDDTAIRAKAREE